MESNPASPIQLFIPVLSLSAVVFAALAILFVFIPVSVGRILGV
jgi:hypothetical protein